MRRIGMTGVVVVAMLFVAAAVWADVAMPRDRWSEIRMLGEHVKIDLSPSKVTVEATFQLKNEKDAVTAVVGYPRGVLEKSLDDFAVTVDGEKVPVASQEGGKPGRPRIAGGPRLRKGGPVKSS